MTHPKLTLRAVAWGALTGILTGAIGLAASYVTAGFTGAESGPVVAVGQLAIDHTPPAVKNFAISEFGSNDKRVLLIGIGVVFTIYAAIVGIMAVRRLRNGMIGLVIFAAIGLIAAMTRPNAGPGYLLPTLIGAAVSAFVLVRLAGAAAPLAAVGQAAAAAVPAGGQGSLAGDAAEPEPEPEPTPGPEPASELEPAPEPAPESEPEPPGRLRGWTPPSWARQPAADDGSPGGTGPGDSDWPEPGQPVPSWRGGPRTASTVPPDRRKFLGTAAVVAGAGVIGYGGGRLLAERGAVTAAQQSLRLPAPTGSVPRLPGADLKIPGLSPFITPNADFYRVDTAIVLPEVPPSSWHLRIHGMVRREINLTFDQLIRRPLIEDYITLTCVSDPVAGPYVGNALWLGASLRSLLREAGIMAGADQLLCTSADGFTSGSPVQTAMDGRDAMLALAMNGTALPVVHGFPVRMVVPGLYGYVSACKWITDIELTTYSSNVSYWAQRGWSAQAPIKTESRIDVPNGLNELTAGRTAVAGVAWAQHKGIDAVEVRVDRGPWQLARLAPVPDIDCWRQWVWYWDATPGQHVIEARATDATGYTQTALQEPPEPNGASGYPIVQVSVNP